MNSRAPLKHCVRPNIHNKPNTTHTVFLDVFHSGSSVFCFFSSLFLSRMSYLFCCCCCMYIIILINLNPKHTLLTVDSSLYRYKYHYVCVVYSWRLFLLLLLLVMMCVCMRLEKKRVTLFFDVFYYTAVYSICAKYGVAALKYIL